tara:strand:- start:606 stop:821 length:216 start_codon:yes stop_codon:yes gene_type:complete
MIVSKFLLNTIAGHLIKHFKLDKVVSYVFEDNELDEKTKNLEDRIKILESMAHPERDFITCNKCKKNVKEV